MLWRHCRQELHWICDWCKVDDVTRQYSDVARRYRATWRRLTIHTNIRYVLILLQLDSIPTNYFGNHSKKWERSVQKIFEPNLPWLVLIGLTGIYLWSRHQILRSAGFRHRFQETTANSSFYFVWKLFECTCWRLDRGTARDLGKVWTTTSSNIISPFAI